MNNYIIKKIVNHTTDFLVFGTSVESPLFELLEIQEGISSSKKEAVVLFDQLLQTGQSSTRFMIMNLVDGCFDYESAKNVDPKMIDENIKALICNYLRENTDILRHSILLSDQKNTILSGGII